MVNENINKRIYITLPLKMISVLNSYAEEYSYVRLSDVIRHMIEDSQLYRSFKFYSEH